MTTSVRRTGQARLIRSRMTRATHTACPLVAWLIYSAPQINLQPINCTEYKYFDLLSNILFYLLTFLNILL